MHKSIAALLFSTAIAAARMLALAVPLAACAASPAADAPHTGALALAAPAGGDAAGNMTAGGKTAPTSSAEGAINRSCRSDADCAVKNVGNCCGYFPACVNVDSQTFPERVKAECERAGRSSICGFPTIEACQCVQGQCEPDAGGQVR